MCICVLRVFMCVRVHLFIVCECVYVYLHVSIKVSMGVYVRMCVSICLCVYLGWDTSCVLTWDEMLCVFAGREWLRTSRCAYMCLCLYVSEYVCTGMFVSACVCICLWIWVRVCVHVWIMYVRICLCVFEGWDTWERWDALCPPWLGSGLVSTSWHKFFPCFIGVV